MNLILILFCCFVFTFVSVYCTRRIAATGRMLLKLVHTKVDVEKHIPDLFAQSDYSGEKYQQ